jgi:hypothetical protein
MTEHSDEQKVGYKSPPKQTQWKKGQSGNPKGKKSKAETLYHILERLVGQEVVVQKNGVQMSMTQGEAMLTAVFSKAMKGDIACVRFIRDVLGVEPASGSGSAATLEVSEADLACLQNYADWVNVIEAAQAEIAQDEGEGGHADATE